MDLINDDLGKLSKVLGSNGLKFEDFKSVPDSLIDYNVSEDPDVVSFKLISVSFDDQGNITSISH
ncbi:MAG: hypothetical protein MUC38_13905 [Cyclobacteriaceae bacterium]|nr:hypothetical protein [Cyclobacteriaceae bacterium]